MTHTEALKMALEALEAADWYIDQLEMIVYSVDDEGTHENRAKVQIAITAFKEALAQPEYRAVKTYHEGKPVYVAQPTSGDYALGYAEGFNDACKKPAQQEPVAYKPLCELCVKRGYTFCANAVKTTPIYTTPQH